MSRRHERWVCGRCPFAHLPRPLALGPATCLPVDEGTPAGIIITDAPTSRVSNVLVPERLPHNLSRMSPWRTSARLYCHSVTGLTRVFMSAELSLIHIIQLSLIHRSSLSLIRMRMRKVLAGPHRTHLGQFGIGRLAT